MDTGHWNTLGVKLDPDNAIGFVYIIVEKETNRKYIGKKNFKGRGKKNSGVVSNWKTYTSSSASLNQKINEKGKENFLFFIIDQYYSVSGLYFAEVWSQITCEIPCKNEQFFNRFIDKITFRVKEPVTRRHKRNLNKVLRDYKYKPEAVVEKLEPALDFEEDT